MKKTTSTVLAAAVSGLLMGGMTSCEKQTSKTDKPTNNTKTKVDAASAGKHVCKGMNECKGKGGCGTTKGKNECKGKGGCATAAHHTCAGKNACKGLGGCGGKAGKNECSGKGGCAVPVKH
ncbi:MAG: hypothetical protein KDC87_03030 [Planctomycetes bacterium]|nr:hypothetical protein [Planctomycetota bacterium]MCB9872353.1 hypothetical protein [Planctomycetota bacterium]MCB9888939.1 hypothetical protein [Planctomycetota bacterium]